jgi:hypothetical protein
MSGILDNKTRIIDFFVTKEGRRQAASGQMKFKFASFTDRHTFYAASGSQESDVAENASNRIFFEAGNRYQDTIVPELEAGQSMVPFKTKNFQFSGATVATGSVTKGFQTSLNTLTGSIPEDAENILAGIVENFSDQRLLGTYEAFTDSTNFVVTPLSGTYSISYYTQLRKSTLNPENKLTEYGQAIVEDLPSLFADDRFSQFSNFKYMPPVNVPLPNTSVAVPMGNYPNLNEAPILSLNELEKRLVGLQSQQFQFVETSRDNNLLGQIFEFSNNKIEKLSIIDFGEFVDNDPASPGKRVFFVGKIVKDSNGSENFLNIFTIVFD